MKKKLLSLFAAFALVFSMTPIVPAFADDASTGKSSDEPILYAHIDDEAQLETLRHDLDFDSFCVGFDETFVCPHGIERDHKEYWLTGREVPEVYGGMDFKLHGVTRTYWCQLANARNAMKSVSTHDYNGFKKLTMSGEDIYYLFTEMTLPDSDPGPWPFYQYKKNLRYTSNKDFAIVDNNMVGGHITLSQGEANQEDPWRTAGQTVTVLIHADEGYTYVEDSVVVDILDGEDAGKAVAFTQKGNQLTFTMPNGCVEVYAQFTGEPPAPDPDPYPEPTKPENPNRSAYRIGVHHTMECAGKHERVNEYIWLDKAETATSFYRNEDNTLVYYETDENAAWRDWNRLWQRSYKRMTGFGGAHGGNPKKEVVATEMVDGVPIKLTKYTGGVVEYGNKGESDPSLGPVYTWNWHYVETIQNEGGHVAVTTKVAQPQVGSTPDWGNAGDTMQITAYPEEGYHLVGYKVEGFDDEAITEPTVNADGTFIMPAGCVKVSGVFAPNISDFTAVGMQTDFICKGNRTAKSLETVWAEGTTDTAVQRTDLDPAAWYFKGKFTGDDKTSEEVIGAMTALENQFKETIEPYKSIIDGPDYAPEMGGPVVDGGNSYYTLKLVNSARVNGHLLSTQATGNGTITAPFAAQVGDTVTVQVQPATGWRLMAGSLKLVSNELEQADLPAIASDATFAMPDGCVKVVGTFIPDSDVVYASMNLVGELSCNGGTAYHDFSQAIVDEEAEGKTVDGIFYFKISDESVYAKMLEDVEQVIAAELLRWGAGATVDSQWELDFEDQTTGDRYLNITQTANAVMTGHVLHAADGIMGGTIAVQTYAEPGEEIPVTITPDEGYHLKNLTFTSADTGEVLPLTFDEEKGTFAMPNTCLTIGAEFEHDTVYHTAVNATLEIYDAAGALSHTGNKAATGGSDQGVVRDDVFYFNGDASGEAVSEAVENLSDWAFDQAESTWGADFGQTVSSTFADGYNVYTTIGLNIRLDTTAHTVHIDKGIAHGSLTVENDVAAAGDEVVVTIVPDDGYVLKTGSLKVSAREEIQKPSPKDPETAVSVTTATFTMPDCCVDVSCEFVPDAGIVYYALNSTFTVTDVKGNVVSTETNWAAGEEGEGIERDGVFFFPIDSSAYADHHDAMRAQLQQKLEDMDVPDATTSLAEWTLPLGDDDEGNHYYRVSIKANVRYPGHMIYVDQTEHGVVEAPSCAVAGETVTVTVTPDEGYDPVLTVIQAPEGDDDRPAITVTDNTFVMPDTCVSVSVRFLQRGDVNVNGKINIVDAQIAYDIACNKYAEGDDQTAKIKIDDLPSYAFFNAANMDQKDRVDACDAFAIQRKAMGL